MAVLILMGMASLKEQAVRMLVPGRLERPMAVPLNLLSPMARAAQAAMGPSYQINRGNMPWGEAFKVLRPAAAR
jgi:hypothetical protein